MTKAVIGILEDNDTPAHPNFVTLGLFAEMRDGAPSKSKDIGSDVVFMITENGLYKILNGRIMSILHEEEGTRYGIMERNGRQTNYVHHSKVVSL